MRRALARKLGWSSTIRTVFAIGVILADGRVQIHTASRTCLVAVRTSVGAPPHLPDACHPHGCGDRPLGGWRHVQHPTSRRIDMSANRDAGASLAARAGRWSAQHRKKAIWGWLAFAFIAFAIGSAVGTETQTTAQSGVGESGRAARTIDNAFPKHQ